MSRSLSSPAHDPNAYPSTSSWFICRFFFFCRNLKCGSVFCGGGGESITGKRATFTVLRVIECKVAVDDDKTRNLDMVPKGTKCGPNKVKLSVRRHMSWSFISYVGCFTQNRLCTGLPWQQMCGRISLWRKGGLCKEMQEQRGEWVILRFEITCSCFQFDSSGVQIQVLDSRLHSFYCIFIFRCVITRKSATVILAGLHPTVTWSMQIYLKVHDTSLELILSQ